jgi:peptidoglycan hydrolase-like protein with peptidoglycan-binding domain
MKRALALITAGVLVGAISARNATAQSTAPAKPNATSSMQHSQPTGVKATHQDSTTAKHHASSQKWSKDQIKEAQAGLTKAGFYKGKEDGIYGKQTRAAVKKYQKENSMPVTGQLSDSLLDKLKSA